MASRDSPNPSSSGFASQSATAEDLFKSQTVGLYDLKDFRKRRVEALEQKEREGRESSTSRVGTPLDSRATTPSDGVSSPKPVKKKRKTVAKGKLSFGIEDEDEETNGDSSYSNIATPGSTTPSERDGKAPLSETAESERQRKRLVPNAAVGNAPKVVTKSALLKEAQTREQLRKDFIAMRDAVKATEFAIPFVFYDGTNVPGGVCRTKKGDAIWLFLNQARKLGAELNVGSGDKAAKEWARVSVDDLMLVRGDIIIPHNYDFYYFIINKTQGFAGPLFAYSAEPTAATPMSTFSEPQDLTNYDPLSRPGKKKDHNTIATTELEGVDEDPTLTKVVDRRWYERNKHIYPASMWEEFDPTKDYTQGVRRDKKGNAFFF